MSTIRVNAIQDTAGVERYTARAWVNFNGTGTVAIRASGNVSSITDLGTGQYRVNFTNALQDANFSVAGNACGDGSALNQRTVVPFLYATNAISIGTTFTDGGAADPVFVNVAVFR